MMIDELGLSNEDLPGNEDPEVVAGMERLRLLREHEQDIPDLGSFRTRPLDAGGSGQFDDPKTDRFRCRLRAASSRRNGPWIARSAQWVSSARSHVSTTPCGGTQCGRCHGLS